MTVALGAAPLGLLERRTRPAAPLAMLDDLAVAMHLPDAAALAAGRPIRPVAHPAVATPQLRAPSACRTAACDGLRLLQLRGIYVAGICGTSIAAGDALHDGMLVVLGHYAIVAVVTVIEMWQGKYNFKNMAMETIWKIINLFPPPPYCLSGLTC